MAAHYHNITLQEMKDFLLPQGFKVVNGEGKHLRDLNRTVEVVFGKRVDVDGQMLSLRVFTGIWPTGESRGVGEDAIRVQMAQKVDDGTPVGGIFTVGGSRRVNRVETWRKNLQLRIDRWQEMIGPKCPKCDHLMVEREGKKGKFWGCTQYRSGGCDGTLPYVIEASAPRCPDCGAHMIRRSGKRGDFYGCTTFPKCRGIVDIQDENE
jgi:hypothetical protein